MSNPAKHHALADRASQAPLTSVLRQGDDQWNDIVRWTIFALIEAEEVGVTGANADPATRRPLGNAGDHGPMMSLDRRWAYNAIRAVGNGGEMYERNLGAACGINLERGINALWSRRGLMYSPPIR